MYWWDEPMTKDKYNPENTKKFLDDWDRRHQEEWARIGDPNKKPPLFSSHEQMLKMVDW